MGRDIIERILPHREPFLFLDAITGVSLDKQSITGRRHIPQTILFFADTSRKIPFAPWTFMPAG